MLLTTHKYFSSCSRVTLSSVAVALLLSAPVGQAKELKPNQKVAFDAAWKNSQLTDSVKILENRCGIKPPVEFDLTKLGKEWKRDPEAAGGYMAGQAGIVIIGLSRVCKNIMDDKDTPYKGSVAKSVKKIFFEMDSAAKNSGQQSQKEIAARLSLKGGVLRFRLGQQGIQMGDLEPGVEKVVKEILDKK